MFRREAQFYPPKVSAKSVDSHKKKNHDDMNIADRENVNFLQSKRRLVIYTHNF